MPFSATHMESLVYAPTPNSESRDGIFLLRFCKQISYSLAANSLSAKLIVLIVTAMQPSGTAYSTTLESQNPLNN